MALATSRNSAWRRATSATRAPSRARRCASSRPMPLDAPVTRAFLPRNEASRDMAHSAMIAGLKPPHLYLAPTVRRVIDRRGEVLRAQTGPDVGRRRAALQQGADEGKILHQVGHPAELPQLLRDPVLNRRKALQHLTGRDELLRIVAELIDDLAGHVVVAGDEGIF